MRKQEKYMAQHQKSFRAAGARGGMPQKQGHTAPANKEFSPRIVGNAPRPAGEKRRPAQGKSGAKPGRRAEHDGAASADEPRRRTLTPLARATAPTAAPATGIRPQTAEMVLHPENYHGPAAATCLLKKLHCGGCPLLALPYEMQLQQKQEELGRLLGRFGTVEPIVPMDEPWNYRNKVISTFSDDARGKLISGIYVPASHRVVPVETCLLQDETADKTVQAVRAAAKTCHLPAFDEDTGAGLLRHCLVRVGKSSGQVMVVIVTPSDFFPGSRNFVSALRKEAAARGVEITTVVQNVNPRRTSAVLSYHGKDKVLFGSGKIIDSLCGLTFALSARSFYQVNPIQTEKLYALALELAALDGSQTVLDAYCGIGTIGLCAAPHAKSVLGIELNADAVHDAAANARHNKITNASFLCADATKQMAALAEEGETVDVAFLDPPREGTTPECIAGMAALNPQRIVYISCNPVTLARDLSLFAAKGYRANRICPVELFPHTNHVEVVCVLSREKGK